MATVFIEIKDKDDGNVGVKTNFVPQPVEGEDLTLAQSIAWTLLKEMKKKLESGNESLPPKYQSPGAF